MDVWEMIDAERAEFADLCDSLTASEWDQTSLCSAWRVRDVVGHVIEVATYRPLHFLGAWVRHGFRLNRMIERTAIAHGTNTTNEALCAEMRGLVGVRKALPGVKPSGVLAGEMIHQQDVRRVLHRDRPIDPERVRIALDDVKGTSASLMPGKKRVLDLYVRALDLEWQIGDANAPGISGPGEAVLMAIAGRPAALADLNGPGLFTLRARL